MGRFWQMLNETQKKIKDKLETYDVILLIGTRCGDDGDLAEQFLNSQVLKESRRKVLVLPVDKCKNLTDLYYTYEFSDRIRVIGVNRQHGSLMNYVANGLLTEQEVFESILR